MQSITTSPGGGVGGAIAIANGPTLSFSIMIHADFPVTATVPINDDGSVTGAGDASSIADDGSVVSQQHQQVPPIGVLPSNAVVVLQEVRFDNEDPLVMRVELPQLAAIPMSRATFHIPAERMSPNEDEPLVFWVSEHLITISILLMFRAMSIYHVMLLS